MAKLYVSEYSGSDYMGFHVTQEPASVEQTPVVIGAGSLQSAAFNAETRLVCLHTDAICSVVFGLNPTATVNSKRMAAGETRLFAVTPLHKVAVIANT